MAVHTPLLSLRDSAAAAYNYNIGTAMVNKDTRDL